MNQDISPIKFCENFLYRKDLLKYFNETIFLDTFAFCLIIQGKFDENHNWNTLAGDKNYFMNMTTYKKLMDFLSYCNGKLIITPAVIGESLRHIFEAIETKYSYNPNKKKIEDEFVDFLKSEIKMFEEKQPYFHEILNHSWIDKVKEHKLRDRLEIGELSIFVESDKCSKHKAIITRDAFKRNKQGECYECSNTILVQLDKFM